jgi:hypothetical protein
MKHRELTFLTSNISKAFLSVTHSGLLEILQIHKTNPVLTHILETAVQNWQINK